MRWLQWSTYDLAKGTGGVEVHARCLQRELIKLGIDARLSMSDSLGEDPWDVIQTHGSAPLPLMMMREARAKGSTLVHTLHGTTIGRMAACREWLWPGGYAAYGREWQGVVQSHVVLGVHAKLHLLHAAKRIDKQAAACGNGWDSARDFAPLSPELESKLGAQRPYFCFVGRGQDVVKNTSLLESALKSLEGARIVAVPGDGFEGASVLKTGALDHASILSVLRTSRGLVLPSHYEGMPLVALEAMGHGIPVFAHEVGGLATLPVGVQGLTFVKSEAGAWTRALGTALADPTEDADRAEENRKSRARVNRLHLKTWSQVADVAVAAVKSARSG